MKLTAPETDDDTSLFSLALALITLSPILLMVSFSGASTQGLRTEKKICDAGIIRGAGSADKGVSHHHDVDRPNCLRAA